MTLKVVFRKYASLDGKTKNLVERVSDGSIIKRFDRTPLPKSRNDVICPHFLELKWAYGCPFNCAWCYLKGTLRRCPEKTKPIVKDFNRIEKHLNSFFDIKTIPEILNSGEITDSLWYENNGNSFSKFIIPKFEESDKGHKILFLTKSTNIKNILSMKPNGYSIMSFSLNAEEVSKRWEKAPSIKNRIKAAAELFNIGCHVRARIDPMVPIQDWEKHYMNLVDLIFSNFEPERITIGSLRGLNSTIGQAKDKSWVKYLSESSNWGRKIEFNLRRKMYLTIINYLRESYKFKKVALCKETKEMWESLKLNYKDMKCNCTF